MKLILEYDGRGYAGFQRQSVLPSVQGALETAVLAATQCQVTVTGAGRTDAGAHARGQVCSFELDSRLDDGTLQRAINALLPHDVAVQSLETVDQVFDPRRQASKREYHYLVVNRSVRSPLWHDRAFHVDQQLNLEAMHIAATSLIGIHDFAAFGVPSLPGRSTVRELFDLRIVKFDEVVRFEFVGSSFLQHMIRSLVGTLIQVGLGKLDPQSVSEILVSRDRGQAAPAVPATGLYLTRVTYGPRALREGSDS